MTAPEFQANLTEKEEFEIRLKKVEQESERKLREFQKKFEELQAQLFATSQKGKGPKRGKGASTRQTLEPSPSLEQSQPSSTRSLRSGFQDLGLETNSESHSDFEILSERLASVSTLQEDDFTIETIYLKKVELTLNGSPLDMLEDRESEGLNFDYLALYISP